MKNILFKLGFLLIGILAFSTANCDPFQANDEVISYEIYDSPILTVFVDYHSESSSPEFHDNDIINMTDYHSIVESLVISQNSIKHYPIWLRKPNRNIPKRKISESKINDLVYIANRVNDNLLLTCSPKTRYLRLDSICLLI